jgi:hypothetical protein
MTNCVELDITGRRNKNPQCQNSSKTMAITTDHIPTLTITDLDYINSSMTTDTITWTTAADCITTGTSQPNYSASIVGSNGYTYTTNTTGPWISTGANTMTVGQSGTIEIKGEDADIKINDKSMVTWMEKVEERLNMLSPNPELEKDWDDLRRLGNRYRALERKCKEKAQMWEALKKVQPKQL